MSSHGLPDQNRIGCFCFGCTTISTSRKNVSMAAFFSSPNGWTARAPSSYCKAGKRQDVTYQATCRVPDGAYVMHALYVFRCSTRCSEGVSFACIFSSFVPSFHVSLVYIFVCFVSCLVSCFSLQMYLDCWRQCAGVRFQYAWMA